MRGEPKAGLFLFIMLILASLPHEANAACSPIGGLCSSAGDCCSLNCNTAAQRCEPAVPWYSGIYVWVALAVLISASFIGLAYMAAQLFRISTIDAWVKIELQELMTGIIIAVLCIAFIASVNASAGFLISEKVNGQPAPNVGEMANAAIANIYGDGRSLYQQLGIAYFQIAKVASYSYTVGTSAWYVSTSISSSPAQGLYPLVSEIGGAMDSVGSLMLFLAAQQSFIIFFINASQIMLPVGIFLRCFSLSRKVGGVVLAAVIASAVIYPASFSVSDAVYHGFQANLRQDTASIYVTPAHNPPLTNLVCSPYMQQFIESPLALVTSLLTSGLGPAGGLITEVVSIGFGGEQGWETLICLPLEICPGPCVPYPTCSAVVEHVYVGIKSFFPILMAPFLISYSPSITSGSLHSDYFDNLQTFALPAASKFGVLALVFSLIPLIIAMSMLRSLAVTFGGEPQLYGISRLI